LDDDETVIEQKPKTIDNVSSKTSTRSTNGSISKKTKVHAQETVSPIAKKQKAIDTDDDDQGLSIEETKPPSSSIVKSK